MVYFRVHHLIAKYYMLLYRLVLLMIDYVMFVCLFVIPVRNLVLGNDSTEGWSVNTGWTYYVKLQL